MDNRSVNVLGKESVLPEPNQELVERAIAKMLDIAQSRGITPTDFIRLLNSGMQISDFLNAIEDPSFGTVH